MNTKRVLIYRLLGALASGLTTTLPGHSGGASIYVSAAGNDANPGTKAKPFGTLERAREELRRLKINGPLKESATVFIRGGQYPMRRTLQLTSEDSGTAQFPVTWRAPRGERVRLFGGVRLSGFRAVTRPAVVERLAPAARGQVLELDLKAAGVTDWGEVSAVAGSEAELIYNGQYMTLARYPNPGEWLRIADIPEGGTRHEYEKVVHYGRFSYESERPAGWKDLSDIWVHGYWVYDWSDQYQRVQRLDLEKKEIWPEPPYHRYGYKKGQRFYFLNVLEELDQPGEWYLDRQAGRLYFWPPGPMETAEVFFPELRQPMLALEEASFVRVCGISFECSRTGAVLVKGGTQDELAGCTVRNVGDTAIDIQGGTRHRVRSCDVFEVAATGISIAGGERKTLARGEHVVENCDIHHYARRQKTYRPAVQLSGVGNRVSHCLIHDAPHQGIAYSGNDHVIEYCDFTRIAEETGDVGATYTMGDWTFMGHEFRYNYFHNIHGPGNLGCFTIYPDLPCGGIHLHGNIFYDVDQVFHSNSGRGMVIENNLFFRCTRGFSFLPWNDAAMFQEGGAWQMVEKLKAVNFDQPPYSTRYPELQRLARDFGLGVGQLVERELPKDNVIRRNVSWGSHFLHVFPPGNLDHVRVETNLIADAVVYEGSFDGRGHSRTYRNGDAEVRAEFSRRGNILVEGDPGLDDLHGFRFRPGSPAAKFGLDPIPFEKIGLVVDEYRQALPAIVYAPTIVAGPTNASGLLTVRLLPTPAPHGKRCVVRYTLDGTEPTPESAVYVRPLEVENGATVRAAAFIAGKPHERKSETVAANFKTR